MASRMITSDPRVCTLLRRPRPAPKDTRDALWREIERDIQLRGERKDKRFGLRGPWKRFLRRQGAFRIYAVDGTWIRNNLSVTFGHGGHGLVHEFIPMDEIWISTHHYHEASPLTRCACKRRTRGQKVSKRWFESCILHEILEHELMRKGMKYWGAHSIALDAERAIGVDPHKDR